jgi:hypothetical protein
MSGYNLPLFDLDSNESVMDYPMNRRKFFQGATAGLALSKTVPLHGYYVGSPENRELPWVEVFPGIWKARLNSPEAYTPVSSQLVPPAAERLRRLPKVSSPPAERPMGQVTVRGCLLHLPLAPYENIYGFGLQMLSFAQRGKKKTIRVNDDPKLDTGDSYAPVPSYVSTRGYGVLVDSCRHVDFYCGDARLPPTHTASHSAEAEVHTPDSTRNLPVDEPGRVTIEVPRAAGVDVYRKERGTTSGLGWRSMEGRASRSRRAPQESLST